MQASADSYWRHLFVHHMCHYYTECAHWHNIFLNSLYSLIQTSWQILMHLSHKGSMRFPNVEKGLITESRPERSKNNLDLKLTLKYVSYSLFTRQVKLVKNLPWRGKNPTKGVYKRFFALEGEFTERKRWLKSDHGKDSKNHNLPLFGSNLVSTMGIVCELELKPCIWNARKSFQKWIC